MMTHIIRATRVWNASIYLIWFQLIDIQLIFPPGITEVMMSDGDFKINPLIWRSFRCKAYNSTIHVEKDWAFLKLVILYN